MKIRKIAKYLAQPQLNVCQKYYLGSQISWWIVLLRMLARSWLSHALILKPHLSSFSFGYCDAHSWRHKLFLAYKENILLLNAQSGRLASLQGIPYAKALESVSMAYQICNSYQNIFYKSCTNHGSVIAKLGKYYPYLYLAFVLQVSCQGQNIISNVIHKFLCPFLCYN